MDTDYNNYAATFACGTVPFIGTVQVAWIYGRGRTLASTYVDKAIAAMKARNLNTNNFVDVNQQGCKN